MAAKDGSADYYSASWRDELVLLAPAIAVFVLVSSQTGFNHHFRYVLPCAPFAFIWISKVARSVELRHWKIAGIAAAALAWSVVSSLSVFPHSLSYFNELAGGPTGGHYHLGNSNTDWGQDLLYLKTWYDEHPDARPLGLLYDLPLVDPRIAGIEYGPVPQWSTADGVHSTSPDAAGPEPGWFALSVNLLHAREHYYDYFLKLQPVAMAGYSIYIYHLSLDDANRLRRELGLDELPAERAPNAAAPGKAGTGTGGLP
ncbi:MAG: hypothetical protein U1A27_15020 [Phycisphaerae bacterium]